MTDHPRLPGRVVGPGELRDVADSWPVDDVRTPYESGYLTLTEETIVDPDGGTHPRAVVRPHGAVGVLALDEDDRVLLITQYRHAVGSRLVELPAGTLDVDGEEPSGAAARELAEEGDVTAATWEPLADVLATPGYSSERWQLWTARDLEPVPVGERHERSSEEAGIEISWLPFADVVDAVLAGEFADAALVVAVLAEQVRRTRP